MHGFYRLKQGQNGSNCWRVTNVYTKYDADCTITFLATETRRSIYTRPTVNEVFDKLSRAVSIKHKIELEKWWSNIFGRFYKILFIRYWEEPFSVQNRLCLVWNKCFFFIFRNMHYNEFIGKDWFKLKISIKFLNFQNSFLGLKFGFKVNECVRISKSEQQYVSNYHNIWKRTQIPVVIWKNILLLHSGFLLIHSMIASLKSEAITLRLLRFFSKYVLHFQYNRYIGVARYTNSLILIWYICLKYLSHGEYHPPYDPKAGQKALIQIINKPDNFHSYETVSKVETA